MSIPWRIRTILLLLLALPGWAGASATAQNSDTIILTGSVTTMVSLDIEDTICDMGDLVPQSGSVTSMCYSEYTVASNVDYWVSACATDINPDAGLDLTHLTYRARSYGSAPSAPDCATEGFEAVIGPSDTATGVQTRTLILYVRYDLADEPGDFEYSFRLLASVTPS